MKKRPKYAGIPARTANFLWSIAITACVDSFNNGLSDAEWKNGLKNFVLD